MSTLAKLAIQKIYFPRRVYIGHEVTVERVVGVYAVLSRRGLEERRSRKRFLDVLYTILCDFRRVLVHFGSWLSGLDLITSKMQENNGLAKSRCMLSCISSLIYATADEAVAYMIIFISPQVVAR